MTPETTYTVPVPADKGGTRLDRLLAEALPALSRTRVKALIEGGQINIAGDNEVRLSPAYRVRRGETFRVLVPAVRPAAPEAQAIPLVIVFEDADVIVVDKPAGLVVHPAAGNPDRTLVNALLAHAGGSLSGIGGVARPGIVHRLDKDTSGLLVVAKNDAAHRVLSRQFASRRLGRTYTALVWGVPEKREDTIEGNIGRSPTNRRKMAVVAKGGKWARTRYAVIRPAGCCTSLLECRLETGRTHQIRVHLASLGHAVVGDPLYGGGAARRRSVPEAVREAIARAGRIALHAHELAFVHPASGERTRFRARTPKDMNEVIRAFDTMGRLES